MRLLATHAARRAVVAAIALLGFIVTLGWPAATAGAGSLLRAQIPTRPPLAIPVAVFGADDRTEVPARLQWVAERVGLVFNNKTRIVCSAFCVADNVIATGAHCMGRGQPPGSVRFADYYFVRNYDRSRDFVRIEGAAGGAAAQHILSGDFRLKVRPPIDAAHDWALVRVPRDTCPAKSLEVKALPTEEIIAHASAGRIFQLSYHRDLGRWRPAFAECAVARDYDGAVWSSIAPDFIDAEHLILHTCDTGGASSGSPLLLESETGPVVVAINVGTYVQTRTEAPKGKDEPRQKAQIVANTAVSANAFADRIAPLAEAPILTASAEIRELQRRLTWQNLYKGRLDGTYGPELQAAIEAYEEASRLPVTGLPTRTLAQRLVEDSGRAGQVAPSTEQMTPAAR